MPIPSVSTSIRLSIAFLVAAVAPEVAAQVHPSVHHAELAPDTPTKPGAPLFDNLGKHHHKITTQSAQAQRYSDQGLILAFGFNHPEAGRSFREAARLDPDCAMAWWGAALILGPNINKPMDEADAARAWEALSKARELAPKATERERAYIEALSKRYAKEPPADRSALDRAYAQAMTWDRAAAECVSVYRRLAAGKRFN